MTEFETTMKELLTNLKSTCMLYARSAAAVANERPLVRVDKRGSWVRGVLGPLTALPAVVFVPVSERVLRYQSGNRLQIERRVSIQVYEKGLDADTVKESLMEMVEDLREALKTNPFIKADVKYDPSKRKTIYSHDLLAVDRTESQPWQTGIVGTIQFEGLFRSNETPGSRTVEPTWKATTSVDVGEQIVQMIKSSSSAWGASGLSTVEVVDDLEMTTLLKLPAVGVYYVGEESNRRNPGRQEQARTYEVWVLSKMLARESALDESLDLAQAIRSVLLKNYRFSKRAVNSEIGTIRYYTEQDKGIYGVVIPLTVESFETLAWNA